MSYLFRLKYVAIVLLILCPIVACNRIYEISIINIDSSLRPTFCVSQRKNCHRGGVDVASFSIREAYPHSSPDGIMWDVFNTGNNELSELKYGEAPYGYRESKAAIPLQLNTYYLIESFFAFKIVNNNGTIEVITGSPSKLLK